MAREGMRFTRHYTGAPVCAPARCILMTGKHGGHAYIRDNGEVKPTGQQPIPADEVTIAEVLKAQGYATGAFGKWGLGPVGSPGDPLKQGFDRFFGYNCQRHAHNLYPRYLVDDDGTRDLPGNTRGVTGETYGPQVIADEMLEFIRARKDKPFFVYYPTVIPHLALQVPEKELEQYRGHWPDQPYTGKSYLPHPTPKAAYAAMISFMDKQVGRLYALLEELALDDNTIVFFTSDNGTTHLKAQVDYEFFNSVDGLRGLKGSVYEGGIRVPLIVRWPGRIRAGSVSEHAGAHYDSLATLADLAGAGIPEGTDGISYLPTLLGKGPQKEHDYLFWDFAGYGGQLAVRMGEWKAVRRGLVKNPQAPLELYHLGKDRGESTDVAASHPEVAKKLGAIMVEAREKPEVAKFQFGEYRWRHTTRGGLAHETRFAILGRCAVRFPSFSP
jgi:arylsulfatase